MKMLKTKRLILLLISLTAIFGLCLTTSLAQEKTQIAGKRYGVRTKTEAIKVGDNEGHVLLLTESKGVDVVTGSQFVSRGFGDYVKGNGPHWGYSKSVDKDGDVVFSKFEAKMTTTLSPAGKPITTFEGTFSFIKGTGKYENAHGGGPLKGRAIGPGIYTFDWEAEYFIKK